MEKRLDVINGAIAWFRENNLPIIVGYTEDEEHVRFADEICETMNLNPLDGTFR